MSRSAYCQDEMSGNDSEFGCSRRLTAGITHTSPGWKLLNTLGYHEGKEKEVIKTKF